MMKMKSMLLVQIDKNPESDNIDIRDVSKADGEDRRPDQLACPIELIQQNWEYKTTDRAEAVSDDQ